MAGKRVFICAAPEDSESLREIIVALDAWQAAHTELGALPEPVVALPAQTERAIHDCEVFLRLCGPHTRASNAVNLATQLFLGLLAQDRRRGRRQRRKLVNLILDPAYPLDDEERKTLYITTEGKARALWLEELAVPVGVATLAQQVSRRALLGMGAGAALTLASAGAAGALLYQQRRVPPLLVRAKISGRPKHVFKLSDTPGGDLAPYARVIQDNGVIYAQPDLSPSDTQPHADSSVYILSPADGKQRRLPIVTGSTEQGWLVAAAQGMLFLYFERPIFSKPNPSEVWAVSGQNGKRLWSVACDYAAAPAISDGAVYCVLGLDISRTTGDVTYNFSLNAFRQKDGAHLWKNADFDVTDVIVPAVANGRLYVGSTDHHIYCLDAKTGHTRWRYLTRGPVLCTPLIANGLVYVGSEDGSVYALDAASGKLRWRFATTDGVVATPFLNDGVVYAGSRDSYIYALDARSGKMFWRAYTGVNPRTDNREIREIQHSFAVYLNVLFATVYGGLYAFDILDGSQRWRYIPVEEEVSVISPPLVSGGLALVGAADNSVYAVNP